MSLQVSKVVKNLKNAIQTLLFYLFVQILDILITGVLSYYSFAE
jgi:DNA repair protein RadC